MLVRRFCPLQCRKQPFSPSKALNRPRTAIRFIPNRVCSQTLTTLQFFICSTCFAHLPACVTRQLLKQTRGGTENCRRWASCAFRSRTSFPYRHSGANQRSRIGIRKGSGARKAFITKKGTHKHCGEDETLDWSASMGGKVCASAGAPGNDLLRPYRV